MSKLQELITDWSSYLVLKEFGAGIMMVMSERGCKVLGKSEEQDWEWWTGGENGDDGVEVEQEGEGVMGREEEDGDKEEYRVSQGYGGGPRQKEHHL